MFVQRLYTLGHEARDLPFARWLLTIMLPLGFALLAWRFAQLGLSIWHGRVIGLGFVESAPAKLIGGQPSPQENVEQKPPQ
jgi:C4-dicarboxylate transporter DctQ subunit